MAATQRFAPSIVFLASFLAPLAARAQESWDAVYIAGSKVGYYHTKVEPVNDNAGNKFLRVRFDTKLNFKRDKDNVEILMQYGTIESLEGSVLKLETRLLSGPAEQRTHGEVRGEKGDKMVLALEAGGVRQEQEIPWGPDVRGPYAAELSLSREPMKPGQTRRIKMFTPFVNKVGYTTLTARDNEEVELGGKVKRSLLRVEGKLTDLDGNLMLEGNSTYWVDSTGQILKTFTDVFGGQATYRTTKEVAMAP
ncbi:MAG TPA: transglutaminase, partial [Isosphaeraceae bacterium]|nr:transglutaminase [Isosphaeraceae bacterium]